MSQPDAQIPILDKVIGPGNPTYIIAEMACAHDGDLDKAKRLIDAAAESGADAVQFEILDPDDNVIPGTEIYELLETLYFSPDQWNALVEHARQYRLAVFDFAYDPVSLELGLQMGVDAIKLNSSDLLHHEMVAAAASSGLPFTLGTGGSTLEEVSKAVNVALMNGGTKMVLMQGVQNFPTKHEYARVGRMQLLRKSFGSIVGFADHTDGSTDLAKVIDLVALGAGAQVLEKHYTWDRSEKGIDHEAALEPAELKEYVQLIHEAELTLGGGQPEPLLDVDISYRLFQKKSVVAKDELPSGEVLTRDKVRFLRSTVAHGVAPVEFASMEGKALKRSVKKFEQIQLADIESN